MNDISTAPDAPSPPPSKSRLAQELIWILGSLLTGLLVLPALTYAVGTRMFGVYKSIDGASGLTSFYADYAHDIAAAHLNACMLAVGPLVLVYVVRLVLGQIPVNGATLRNLFKKPEDSKAG